jgi:hypothetical protein
LSCRQHFKVYLAVVTVALTLGDCGKRGPQTYRDRFAKFAEKFVAVVQGPADRVAIRKIEANEADRTGFLEIRVDHHGGGTPFPESHWTSVWKLKFIHESSGKWTLQESQSAPEKDRILLPFKADGPDTSMFAYATEVKQ